MQTGYEEKPTKHVNTVASDARDPDVEGEDDVRLGVHQSPLEPHQQPAA